LARQFFVAAVRKPLIVFLLPWGLYCFRRLELLSRLFKIDPQTEAATGSEPARVSDADVPPDAATPARFADEEKFLHIGDRESCVKSEELAGRQLNTLPDLPDVRDRRKGRTH
jgi:hypothetical protein